MVTFDPIVDNEEHVKALNDSSLVKGNFKDYWEVAYDKERSGKGSTHTGASETDGRQKQPSETAVRKQLFQKQPRTTEKTPLVYTETGV